MHFSYSAGAEMMPSSIFASTAVTSRTSAIDSERADRQKHLVKEPVILTEKVSIYTQTPTII